MTLALMMRDGVYQFIVRCNYCGEELGEGRRGNVQWVMLLLVDPVRPSPTKPYFTCKGCAHAFEREHPLGDGAMWGSMDLELFPVYLASSLGVDFATATQRAAILAGL